MKGFCFIAAWGLLGVCVAQGATEIIPEGETQNVSDIHLEAKEDRLENRGQLNVNGKIQMVDGELINYGTITETDTDTWSDLVHLAGTNGTGSIINYGRIEGTTTVNSGTLTAMDGSYMTNLDLYSYDSSDALAALYVNGAITIDGTFYTEDTAQIIFTLDGSIDMNGNDLEYWGAEIILDLGSEFTFDQGDSTTDFRYLEKDNLFINVGSGNISSDTVITLRDGAGHTTSRQYGEIYQSVPEPATGTLSLLALSVFALRRRRK